VVFEGFVRARNVLGNIDHDGTRSTGGGDMKRLLDDPRYLSRVAHLEAVLHDRSRNTDHVRLLKSILTDQVTLHLSGDHDHRDRIHVGRGDTGHRIRRAGPRRHQHHTGLTRGARIAVRRMRGRLFVAHENVRDLAGLEQRVVDVQDCAARITKDKLNALILESADDHLAAR
jgi:hypothetical protein